MRIAVVVGTVRRGRKSIHVANYLMEELAKREGVEGDLVDLKALDLPLVHERIHYMEANERPAGLVKFQDHISNADAVILVAPEYNGGYPAALKNVLDALYSEYYRKPFAITCVSSGFGGYTVITQLREVINRFKGMVVPIPFMARNAATAFDDEGKMINEHYPKGANAMLDELVWYSEAILAQKNRSNH